MPTRVGHKGTFLASLTTFIADSVWTPSRGSVSLVIGSTYLGTFPGMIMLGIGAGPAIRPAAASVAGVGLILLAGPDDIRRMRACARCDGADQARDVSVSYTHLTLPTNRK